MQGCENPPAEISSCRCRGVSSAISFILLTRCRPFQCTAACKLLRSPPRGTRSAIRPSWCAIFTKAYAIVAARRAQRRRAYLSFPRPHLYEHFCTSRQSRLSALHGEEAVLFAHVRSPEDMPLAELDGQLRRFKEQPIESIGSFRHALKLSSLPRPIRRLGWWFALNCWGRSCADYIGTYGVSVYAGLGAASLHPLSPLTTTLNYGVVEADGSVDVRLVYDHRVLDGAAGGASARGARTSVALRAL